MSAATAAAWPLAVGAQQPTMPAIGFLDSRSPEAVVSRLRAFRQGLQETGNVEGENVAIVYRFAEKQLERLSDLAKDLVERRVAVIVTPGEPSAFAAKAATATIPVVFGTADDLVKVGLVAMLARPDGNITGINFLAAARYWEEPNQRNGRRNPRSSPRARISHCESLRHNDLIDPVIRTVTRISGGVTTELSSRNVG